jgi:hypothetical protein
MGGLNLRKGLTVRGQKITFDRLENMLFEYGKAEAGTSRRNVFLQEMHLHRKIQ